MRGEPDALAEQLPAGTEHLVRGRQREPRRDGVAQPPVVVPGKDKSAPFANGVPGGWSRSGGHLPSENTKPYVMVRLGFPAGANHSLLGGAKGEPDTRAL